jgi:hypothetical protein
MLTVILLTSLLTGFPVRGATPARPAGQGPDSTSSVCSQPAAERDALIREAQGSAFMIRRVEFLGNERTRDYVLRRRLINLTEGDVFARGNLAKSLRGVSRLRVVHPVGLGDVVIHLDRAEKLVDMEICFRERPRKSGSGRRAS